MSTEPADLDRLLDESAHEQARLTAELQELQRRSRVADEGYTAATSRMRARFLELTEAARVELERLEQAYAAEVAALHAEVDAEAGAALAAVGDDRSALGSGEGAPDGP